MVTAHLRKSGRSQLIKYVIISFDRKLISYSRLLKQIRLDVSASDRKRIAKMNTNKFALKFQTNFLFQVFIQIKKIKTVFTKRDELLLRVVLALPYASSTGFVDTICSSRLGLFESFY